MFVDELKTADARMVWRLERLGFKGVREPWEAFWECDYEEYIEHIKKKPN